MYVPLIRDYILSLWEQSSLGLSFLSLFDMLSGSLD